MKREKICFIGGGNMGEAIIRGLIDKKLCEKENIWLYEIDKAKQEKFSRIGVNIAKTPTDGISESDFVLLALKPGVIRGFLTENKEAFQGKVVISIAASVPISLICQVLGDSTPAIRIMPNTPMLVGKGASAISANDNVTKKDFQYICRLFSGISLVSVLEEENMNRVISVNGSSPAYVYAFIRGMLNGAIEQGIDEKQALPLILRTIEGAVKMVEKSDVSIDTLIERVCSPGGTTLEAMKVFSEKDFEKIIAQAMTACTNRADEITETL